MQSVVENSHPNTFNMQNNPDAGCDCSLLPALFCLNHIVFVKIFRLLFVIRLSFFLHFPLFIQIFSFSCQLHCAMLYSCKMFTQAYFTLAQQFFHEHLVFSYEKLGNYITNITFVMIKAIIRIHAMIEQSIELGLWCLIQVQQWLLILLPYGWDTSFLQRSMFGCVCFAKF